MQQTFFSYSRTDAAFALRLANDLRASGADIWIDQLDIEPGARWDAAIQAALKESNDLIVVLSPKAVASENIMDEVSFALEHNRRVVPVLIEQCEIPFRLKRLQYISFIEGYDKGYERLRAVLAMPPDEATASSTAARTATIEGSHARPANPQQRRVLIGLALLAVLATAFFAIRHFGDKADTSSPTTQMAGLRTGIYKSGHTGAQYYVLKFNADGTVSASDWLRAGEVLSKDKLNELSGKIPASPYQQNGDSVIFDFSEVGYDESYRCVISGDGALRCNRKDGEGQISQETLTLMP